MRLQLDKTLLQRIPGSDPAQIAVAAGRLLYVLERNGALDRVIDPDDVEATETLVVGFTTEAGATEVTQPLTANSDGQFPAAWFPPGSYDLYMPADVSAPVKRWEAVSGLGDEAAVAVLRESPVNVKDPDYGAVGDGVTDDTAAIDAAAAASLSADTPLFFPAGTYNYNGAGIEAYHITGAGRYQTNIVLGANPFVKWTAYKTARKVSGITFHGGTNVIRSTFTGVEVNCENLFYDLTFYDYTGAAISNEASDSPYWMIDSCQFRGLTDGGTMGVALSGDSSGSSITRCSFEKNQIGVKLRGIAGQDVRVLNNTFLRYAAYVATPRTDLWVVPASPVTYIEGSHLLVKDNKFGNENCNTNDYRVLIADEGSGADITTKFPSYAASTGHSHNQHFCDNLVAGDPDFIVSTTPNFSGSRVENQTTIGGSPAYVIRYSQLPWADQSAGQHIVGPMVDFTQSVNLLQASNAPGSCVLIDPDHRMVGELWSHSPVAGVGDLAGFAALSVVDAALLTLAGAGTRTVQADAAGGTDALNLAITTAYEGWITQAIAPTRYKPMWIEFDLREGVASSVTHVSVRLHHDAGYRWERRVRLQPEWTHYRFPAADVAGDVNGVTVSAVGTAVGSFRLGRLRVYHAKEPVNCDKTQLGVPAAISTTASPWVIPATGQIFSVDGTASPDTITASWPGRVITLVASGASWGLVDDGGNLRLSADFEATADDTITLVCDGTNWHEVARSVN